jgi:ankyrin repeat protein
MVVMSWKSPVVPAAICLLASQVFGMITRPVPADLFEGVRRGQVAKVRLCVWSGVELNTQERRSGTTALQEAARRGNARIVAMLARAGARPNIADSRGRTPLHEAAAGCHYQIARILVLVGADVNAHSEQGATPLRLAEEVGCAQVSALLRTASGQE